MNYVRACKVECCDESVQCVFSHTKAISPTQTVTTEGYLPHDGPSSLCTGGARRSAAPLGAVFWALVALNMLFSVDAASMPGSMRSLFTGLRAKKLFWVGSLVVIALSMQGCGSLDVPIHRVANWRAEPDYLITNQFIPPGGSGKVSNLNSCSYPTISPALQCSGRGVCKRWDQNDLDNPLMFCECDRAWADPECRTKRKSQTVAYALSIFAGFLGADQFYLGYPVMGILKIVLLGVSSCGYPAIGFFTFGGCGIWWIYDIIRIGSAPVPAENVYSTAQDLPHFAYVLTVVMFALVLGFAMAHRQTLKNRFSKRRQAMEQIDLFEGRDAYLEGPKPKFADAYRSGFDGRQARPIIAHEGFPDFEKMFPNPYQQGKGGAGGSMSESVPLLSDM